MYKITLMLLVLSFPLGDLFAQEASMRGGKTSYEYQISVGDSLNVFVWRNSELTVSIPVRPDGRISLPLINELVAAGKTPHQLADEIKKALARFIKQPEVSVMVVGFGVNHQSAIKIIGNAQKLLSVPYVSDLTLLDVLIHMGGVSENVSIGKAKVLRLSSENKRVEIAVDLDALLNDGDLSQNLPLKPSDVLLLPERWF